MQTYFLKWANAGLFLFIFVLFTLLFKFIVKNSKRICCARDSNLGPQVGADGSLSYGGRHANLNYLSNSDLFITYFGMLSVKCFTVSVPDKAQNRGK